MPMYKVMGRIVFEWEEFLEAACEGDAESAAGFEVEDLLRDYNIVTSEIYDVKEIHSVRETEE